jgi:hypothetical protein
MIIIGIILSFITLGFFCGLLFLLAVHALPVLAGATQPCSRTIPARAQSVQSSSA